jgi:zinc and cadmium transporter
MNLLGIILLFNLLGSVVSLLGGVWLFFNEKLTHKISHFLSSYAAGALLGAALFDLLPEAIEEADIIGGVSTVFTFTLLGILFFFLLERFLHWFHHHGYEDHKMKSGPVIPLIVIGDTIHNFIDGMVIAATFLVNIPLGIVTTFAVGAHEIPQEIGDFGVMIKNGLSRGKAITINILSAMASFLGVILAFYLGDKAEGFSIIALSVASGFFLYIALSDLIPEIHRENKKGFALWEASFLIFGIGSMYFGLFLLHEIFQIGH